MSVNTATCCRLASKLTPHSGLPVSPQRTIAALYPHTEEKHKPKHAHTENPIILGDSDVAVRWRAKIRKEANKGATFTFVVTGGQWEGCSCATRSLSDL